ncbi:DUF2550 domain-containing protein [Corynebacterium glyciniphilum]|uniref:Secreted protein n=1 Tax=Corynebacterium glyciniphilum AJ 3170 TaxID=1404245 RepID=X5E8Q9_9CORY|nr:DUF2550 domain-containing protein [Corynebacterium glyciniphilum]AHW63795.1 hypothetical protein CGLY_06750 [Corynebacterium glyciniphilum AJ 3170]
MLLNILVTVVVIVLVCGALIAGARFLTLRSRGIPVVVRSLPNPDGRHWRHGVLVYGSGIARVYKLRSVRPESDLQLSRHHTEITDRRPITRREAAFLESELHVMTLLDGKRTWEVALDDAGDTALVSWLESAPSERMVRSDMRMARKRGIR